MADKARWERGQEMLQEVYAGDVVTAPRGAMAFSDIMLETLFAEVWTRTEILSIRDRRLLMLGSIIAMGEHMTFRIQLKAAMKNGELNAEQARETLIHMAQYAGYPRVAGLVGEVEAVIAEVAKEQAETDES
jgi:4-carboxymuconolactone decarboxylase